VKEINLTLKGHEDSIRKVLSLLSQLRVAGNHGHTGRWRIDFDGDGSDTILFNDEYYNPEDLFGVAEI